MIGVSILNLFFQSGFDPNNALAQISTLVMSDLHYLPPGTQPPIVIAYDPTAALPVGMMTIFTPVSMRPSSGTSPTTLFVTASTPFPARSHRSSSAAS